MNLKLLPTDYGHDGTALTYTYYIDGKQTALQEALKIPIEPLHDLDDELLDKANFCRIL